MPSTVLEASKWLIATDVRLLISAGFRLSDGAKTPIFCPSSSRPLSLSDVLFFSCPKTIVELDTVSLLRRAVELYIFLEEERRETVDPPELNALISNVTGLILRPTTFCYKQSALAAT